MTGSPPPIPTGEGADLFEVRLIGVPIDVRGRAAEHIDELRREFTLLRAQQEDRESADVPIRLLTLVDDLEERFSGFTEAPAAQLEAAIDAGATSVDLVVEVPIEAKEAALQLGAMLDEADEYCRSGGDLLTLATPPEALAYRRWYLEEFSRQLDGLPARPWAGS